jgi:hypothetical protein
MMALKDSGRSLLRKKYFKVSLFLFLLPSLALLELVLS